MIRYPGSKAKLWHHFWANFPPEAQAELFSPATKCYCEPFFGSGAIGWQVMRLLSPSTRVILNDLDDWLSCLWLAVRDDPQTLINLIKGFTPSAEAFYQFKARKGDTTLHPTVRGFQNLALHMTSFSGLGTMAGGPLGGKKGTSAVGSRWNPARLAREVKRLHAVLGRFRTPEIHALDFDAVFDLVPNNPSSFVFLDPPYYAQGPGLYFHAFTDDDHRRLAARLRSARFRWLLTYDDHPAIRRLYSSWACIDSFEMTPMVRVSKRQRQKCSELVIRNFECEALSGCGDSAA